MVDKRNTKKSPARQRGHHGGEKTVTLRPDYYSGHDGKECIEIIRLLLEAYTCCKEVADISSLFCLGNAIKYEFRMGRKNGATDDEKKRDTYLAMGKIDAKWWKDIAKPVINHAVGGPSGSNSVY